MVHKEVLVFYMVLAGVSLAYGVKNKLKCNEARQELCATKKLLSAVLAKNDFLVEKQRSTSSLRHDMRNHLQAIVGYLRKGDLQDAQRYIKSLTTIKACLQQEAFSGNAVVDSVVGAALAKAPAKVKLSWNMLLPQEMPITPPDLTILLGNLVENAVEAVENKYESFIHVETKVEKNHLVVVVSNSFSSEDRGASFSGSTKGPEHRGLGFKNVQRVVDRYNGVLNVRGSKNIFTVMAFLHLQAPTS